MPLNKSKGNMYEFITHTWNPLGGECLHKCSYCSTHKLMRYPAIAAKYTGPPCLVEKELLTNLGSGNFIFVVAQNDMFASGIPDMWINKILDHCRKYDNRYLFQTKNPGRILFHSLPPKSTICTTIESDIYYPEIMKYSPRPHKRALHMEMLSNCGFDTYVTIEPVLDFNLKYMVSLIKQCKPEQVNIGADSSNNNLPEPRKEKVLQLIFELEKFTNIHKKSNLQRLL